MKKQKGFSLIELLVVVAIILIIAAMAIPNLLHARMAANEASAVSSIRTINSAEVTYESTYPDMGYAQALTILGGPGPCTPSSATSCLIDDSLATASPGNGSKSGYVFLATGLNPSSGANAGYTAAASPVAFGQTGVRNFCSNEDGVIRVDPGSSGSTPVNDTASCEAFTGMQ